MNNPTRAEDAEIASIVRGLSPLSKSIVIAADDMKLPAYAYATRLKVTSASVAGAMRRMSLLWVKTEAGSGGWRYYGLSPLGIAVRAALLENAHVEG
jgi:hypothetical protein